MLEFIDSMNQKLERGNKKGARQDKMIKLLMMQGARFFFQQKNWPM